MQKKEMVTIWRPEPPLTLIIPYEDRQEILSMLVDAGQIGEEFASSTMLLIDLTRQGKIGSQNPPPDNRIPNVPDALGRTVAFSTEQEAFPQTIGDIRR